jgi:hypothetical protein
MIPRARFQALLRDEHDLGRAADPSAARIVSGGAT